jgi:hypothetical protein
MSSLAPVTEPGAANPRPVSPLTIGIVLAVALIIGVVAWLVLSGDDEDGEQAAGAKAVSVEELQNLAGGRDRPVFWAGPRSGTKYEFTETKDGSVYVRYLARNAEVGDPKPSYLTVATYAIDNGYARVEAASKRKGAESEKLQNGGLALVNRERPSSVYLAYPRGKYQVEVYDPSPDRARDLVFSGAVQPVR